MASLFQQVNAYNVIRLRHLPQAEIAERLGISQWTVSKILADSPNYDSVFDCIDKTGDEGRFIPKQNFIATDHPPGSPEKVNLLRRRLEEGVDLHHPADANCLAEIGDYSSHRDGIQVVTPPKSRGKEAA